MDEDAILFLKYECKEIKEKVDKARDKLRLVQEELEVFTSSKDIKVEKSKSKKRELAIEQSKLKIQELKSEYSTLLKAVAAMEKDKINFNNPELENRRNALDQVILDIRSVDDELFEMTESVRKAKEENLLLEKDIKRRMELFEMDLARAREEGMAKMSMEEEETRMALEELKVKVKKFKLHLADMRHNVSVMKTQCADEEKKNAQIQIELDDNIRFKEKLKREEERVMAELGLTKT